MSHAFGKQFSTLRISFRFIRLQSQLDADRILEYPIFHRNVVDIENMHNFPVVDLGISKFEQQIFFVLTSVHDSVKCLSNCCVVYINRKVNNLIYFNI